jgi:sugar phosphate permease
MVAFIAFFTSQWALYFIVAWMPIYLQQGRHLSENHMKLATSYLFIIGIAGGFLGGLFSDWLVKRKGLRFGRRFMGVFSLGMIGFCFLITATVSNNSIAVFALITSYFFLMFFGITAFSTCVDIGGEKAGTVAGMMNFIGQIGAFFLAIVFGKLVDVMHNYNRPLFLIAGLLFIGALRWAAVDATKKIEVENIGPNIHIKDLTILT